MKLRIITAALLFAVTWLLWSGVYKPLWLGLGAFSCGLVLWLALRTGFFKPDNYAFHLGPRLPRYWGWLLKEIGSSSLAVARIVLDPRLPVSPMIVTVDASQLSRVAQVTLANAITLTPGTVTVDIDAGVIEVHCLTRANAADLQAGEMLRRAANLVGG